MAEKGYNCVLKIGGNTLGKARNFDPTYTTGEQDITTRASAGWRERQGGLKEWTASIEALWVATNTQLQALWNAYVAGTPLLIYWDDGAGNGRQGDAIVTTFHPGPQDLENAVLLSIDLASTGAVTVIGAGS